VLVDSESSPSHPSINVDDEGGAEAAARHLLELGHRQLAIIVLPPARAQVNNTPTAARRLSGYQKAIRAAGAPEPYPVVAGISVAAGARAFESLPRGQRRPNRGRARRYTAGMGAISAGRA